MSAANFLLRELKRANDTCDYINCTSTISSNSIDVGRLFVEEINKTPFCNYAYVGGLENGAIIVAQAIVDCVFDLDGDHCYKSFYVRKTEKNSRFIEKGFASPPQPGDGTPVVIVDDVLNTGFSVAKAAKAVEQEWGYKPTLAVVLVDNEMGGKEFLKSKGIECRSIFTRKEVLG